jgi:hypothetical protein
MSDGEAFAKIQCGHSFHACTYVPARSALTEQRGAPSLLPTRPRCHLWNIGHAGTAVAPGAAVGYRSAPHLLGDLVELTIMPTDEPPHGGTELALAAAVDSTGLR